jgi:hypothetical protein
VTCEVAVMNKHGVALAADSALSISDGQKVYHTAEKLFKIADAPIAIMTYGCAEIMGVPWEIVIKSYIRQLGERRFSAAQQYGEDFLRFVEASDMLFPASVQRDWFRRVVESVWKTDIREPWRKKLDGAPRHSPHKTAALLLQTIKEELAGFRDIAPIEQLSHAYGEQIVSEYADVLKDLETRLFHDVHLTDEIRDALRLLVKLMHTHQWFHPDSVSGLIVAGFGEAEPFPSLYIYNAGAVVASRLRWLKVDEAHVDREHPVIVIPFAQTDMIDLFCTGIYPALKERLVDIIVKCLPPQMGAKSARAQAQETAKTVQGIIDKEFQEIYTLPLISAVEVLSRFDLAKMAEALISLTAFKARMSSQQQETVGGPIDVAVISKGEGFAWVKQKNTLKQEDAATFLMP